MTTRQLRHFGFLVGGLFAVWFGLLLPFLGERRSPIWPWATALVLMSLALLAPGALRYPYVVWMHLGNVLGWLNSRILLNLMFFLIFAPAGMVARLFGWDPLERAFQPQASTYRIVASSSSISHMEKPY